MTSAFRVLAIGTTVAVLLVLLFYQPLAWMWSAWLSDPYYSHGPLIPAVALALIWRLRHRLSTLPGSGSQWGLAIVGLAVTLAALAISWQAFFAASLALPLLAGGIALQLRGWAALRLLLFPIAYLVLMVPVPVVGVLALHLQVFTSVVSATVVRLLGAPAEAAGAAVSLPGVSYVVGVACSGLNSMMALVALGLLLAYLIEGHGWARLALVASLVPITMLANVLRVSSLLEIAYYFGGDAGLAYHDTIAGPLFWGLALGLLGLSCRTLRCRLTYVA